MEAVQTWSSRVIYSVVLAVNPATLCREDQQRLGEGRTGMELRAWSYYCDPSLLPSSFLSLWLVLIGAGCLCKEKCV